MLDKGVYTLAEVAKYTGLPPATLRAWFMPRSDKSGNGPIFVSDYDRIDGDFAVSFLNLIEARVASLLRERNFKPSEIRQAHATLQELLNTKHPFAHEGMRTNVDLGAKVKAPLKFPKIFAVRGSTTAIDAHTRDVMLDYVAPRLNTVTYDQHQLAETWEISTGIVINPRLSFGHPAVKEAGVSTLILAKQYQANRKNASLVARMFNTTPEDVVRAVDFEAKIRRLAA